MTRSVRLLPNQVIDQIAAGEVVERPASVVKELVENSLDSGATRIDIALLDGGKALIRIADDGCGMSRIDARMAIERHATSKLRGVEDLQGIETLGFRGEALPSIASVSRFQLVTRSAEEEAGTKIRIDAGVLVDVTDVGAPRGTVIEVRDLFHTLPARRAFLRTAATELSHCTECIVRIALGRPEVAFELRHDDRVTFFCPATTDPAVRVRELLGADAEELLPVDAESRSGLRLVGLIAPPSVHRPTLSTALYLYVDGRWVRDQVVRRAVSQVYRGLVPEGRHPVVVLELRVPAGAVDVNVHPTKAEVRFRDPASVAAFITDTLRSVLGREKPRHGAQRVDSTVLPFHSGPIAEPDSAPSQTEVTPARPRISALPEGLPPKTDSFDPLAALHAPLPPVQTLPAQTAAAQTAAAQSVTAQALPVQVSPARAQPPAVSALPPDLPPATTPPAAPSARGMSLLAAEPAAPALVRAHLPGATAVGLARARWVFIDDGQELCIVDGGRLARKRLARLAQGPPQRLLVPRRVPSAQREIEIVEAADHLADLGLLVGRFSPGELAVRAIPPSLQDVDPVELLRVAIRALLEGKDVRDAWGEQLPAVVPIGLEVLDGADWKDAVVQRISLPK